MCAEAGSPKTSHILTAIEQYCKLDIADNTCIVNLAESTKEGNLVLGWFKYPIITRTELDMLKQIKEWGYEDIMQMIWFCHTPINGTPCGMCHPCEVKIKSDMAFLLPDSAQKRYRHFQFINKTFGNVCANAYKKLYVTLGKG